MTAERKQDLPQTGKPPTSTAPVKEARKTWVKKTPVEVVLEQITKQEDKVNEMREQLKKEERELQKLQQAKKVLEAV
jgi:small-conductance mechanosensitive channel